MANQNWNGTLTEGMPVYDESGEQLGTIKEVRGDAFKVDAPMQPDFWLRADCVRSFTGGRLMVMTGADRFEQWDGTETVTTTRTEHAHTGRAHAEREDADTLKLREERLRVGKEREQAGEVTLGKRVVERTETAEVPVREERVVIERRPVNERTTGEITDDNRTIEVEVERERVVAEKEAVVTEEVGVRKEVTERTQPVQATVRKEELVVEGEGDLVEGGRNANMPRQDTYEQERTRR